MTALPAGPPRAPRIDGGDGPAEGPGRAGPALDLDAVVAVDAAALVARLSTMPDDVNALVRLADGQRTLRQIIERSPRSDDAAAALLARLHAEGVLRVVAAPGPGREGATPEPDGAAWFADPAAARRPGEAPSLPPRPAAVRVEAPRSGAKAPVGVVAVVVALALVILVGPEWARHRRAAARPPPVAGPAAAPAAVPDDGAHDGAVPPALAVTAPAAPEVRLPPAEPRPADGADPGAAAWIARGDALLAHGETDAARDAYARALAEEPTGPRAAAARAALERLRR